MGKPSRVLGYARVSTSEQASSGLGMEAQLAKIEAWCRLHDVVLVGVVRDDGASARTLDRPGLQDALARLRRGDADGLVVAKLDRLTRSVRDLGTLVEDPFATKALISVGESIDTSNAAGRLVLNVLGSVAQWERESTSERTRDALRAKKARGERSAGSVPFGMKLGADGRTLKPHAKERAVIERVRSMRTDGLSVARIVEALNEERVPARGSRWHATTVSRLLRAAVVPSGEIG